jgi:hypothetical protein
MKKVFAFLILCMALALARILLLVLAVVLLLALVHAFITRPRETLVFLGTLILSSLAVAQPLAFIGGVVVVVVVASTVRHKRRTGRQANARLITADRIR